MAKFKVLCTKKILPELIDQAERHDIIITEKEFISVKPIMTKEKWEEVFHWIEAQITFVVFTSAHAVEAINKYLHPFLNRYNVEWKIYCLSGRTKQAVEDTHELCGKIVATAENARGLAEKILEHEVTEVLFFCGDQRRDELPQLLQEHGVIVHQVIAYHTQETPVTIENDLDGILFFSPSAVNSFFSMNKLNENTVCFAIGQTTSQAIAGFTGNSIIISKCASQESMMEALQQFMNK